MKSLNIVYGVHQIVVIVAGRSPPTENNYQRIASSELLALAGM